MRNGNLGWSAVGEKHCLDPRCETSWMKSTREMSGKSYKILRPSIAILAKAGKRVAITIPEGAFITVIRAPLDDSHVVEARWENKTVKMFVTDLREHATLVHQQ